MPRPPVNIWSGYCCAWGGYNTTQQRKGTGSVYEPSPLPIQLINRHVYLTSIYIKISSLIVVGNYEIYILDTNVSPVAIQAGGIAAAIAAGGTVITISDIKTPGGVLGYDPTTEEMIRLACAPNAQQGGRGGEFQVYEMRGRPIVYGLVVALVNPATGLPAGVANALSIDSRYLMPEMGGC
jgi:hypothetical protein